MKPNTEDQLIAEVHSLRMLLLSGDFREMKKRAGRISRLCDRLITAEGEKEFGTKVSDSELEASLSALTPNYNVGGDLVYYSLSGGQIVKSGSRPEWGEEEQN